MGDYYDIKEGPGVGHTTAFVVTVQRVFRVSNEAIKYLNFDVKNLVMDAFMQFCEGGFEGAWSSREVIKPEAEKARAECEGREAGR